jgi:hypothetical protein
MPYGAVAHSHSMEHFLSSIAVVWVAPDVFERTLTWEETKALLRAIHLESAVLSIAMVNAVCAELALCGSLGNVSGASKVRALANYLFPDEVRGRAMQVYVECATQAFIPLARRHASR